MLAQSGLPLAQVLLVLFFFCTGLQAAIVPASIQRLTESSGFVVEGRVEKVESVWNKSRTQIFSFVTITISELHKGSFPNRELILRVPGGVIEEESIGEYSPELPTFYEDTEVVVFVKSNFKSIYPVVGETQGLFMMTEDEESGQVMAVSQSGLSLMPDALRAQIRAAAQR